jgi:hypothetical protein
MTVGVCATLVLAKIAPAINALKRRVIFMSGVG